MDDLTERADVLRRQVAQYRAQVVAAQNEIDACERDLAAVLPANVDPDVALTVLDSEFVRLETLLAPRVAELEGML